MDKLELTYDHFKDSYELSKESQADRNKLFILLALIMAIQYLFIIEPDSLIITLSSWLLESFHINLIMEISVIQSFLWFILLYFTIRYYQVNTYIERQYKYIHKLEKIISIQAGIEFDRESFNYLNGYPKVLDFISIIYRVVFPVLYAIIITIKIIFEILSYAPCLSLLLDIILAVCCFVLTCLYLYFLHKECVLKKIYFLKAWLHR